MGEEISIEIDDYHSHNTTRLSQDELILLLNKIGYC